VSVAGSPARKNGLKHFGLAVSVGILAKLDVGLARLGFVIGRSGCDTDDAADGLNNLPASYTS